MEIRNSIMKYKYTGEDAKLLYLKNSALQDEIDILRKDNAWLKKQNTRYRSRIMTLYAHMLDALKCEVKDSNTKLNYALMFLCGMAACFVIIAIMTVIVICCV